MRVCTFCGQRFASNDWQCPRCGWAPLIRKGFISFLNEDPLSGESFDSEYFARLHHLEKENFWFQHRTRLIIRAIEEYFPYSKKILEIGCGTGLVLSEVGRSFSDVSLSGSDLFVEGLHFAKSRMPDAAFYQMDACCMPFEDEFDLILALDVLEHIEDDSRAINELCRSLKYGGGLIITVPQHQWLWSIQDEKAYHKRRYARKELMDKLVKNGFQVIYATSFITLLLPVLVFSRIYGRIITRTQYEYDPMRELKIAYSLNRILCIISKTEELLLRAGISFPAGGSLLCIGRKGR
ncbi:MAG: class I SAM-dependent methyltransferase [Desulfomonilia bacterium]|jgi:ubiquinone/menaquinone biosynthesis C-methylase UbiE